MILQHLLFPTANICSEQELYYRTDGNLDVQPQFVQAESGLPLQKGVWYTFNTYFNGFSVGVWQTHTSVRRIQLRLRLFLRAGACRGTAAAVPSALCGTDGL